MTCPLTVSTSMQRPAKSAAAASTSPMQQQRQPSSSHALKRSWDSQQVSSSHATDPVSCNERISSVNLMAAGALLKCFPHLKKQRSLGASSCSRGSTPGMTDRHADSARRSDLPPRPSLVYDAKCEFSCLHGWWGRACLAHWPASWPQSRKPTTSVPGGPQTIAQQQKSKHAGA